MRQVSDVEGADIDLKLNERQARQLYLVLRLHLQYVMSAASKEHCGLNEVDEAFSIMDSLTIVGLLDSSIITGKYLDPRKPAEEKET